MSYNRCKDIHKFGNKYLPLAYKTQVDFRSHFSGKKVRLMVREIRYIVRSFMIYMCNLVPRLRMSGAVIPLPPHSIIACMGTSSPVYYCMPSGIEIKDVNMKWCVTEIDEVKKIH